MRIMISKNTKLWLARIVVWAGYTVIGVLVGITLFGLVLMIASANGRDDR